MTTAFDVVRNLIDAGHNVFVSGVGGCGKTYLMKQLFQHYKKHAACVLTSTTGISAYNLGGTTLHAWSKIILPNSSSSVDIHQWVDTLVNRLRRNARVSTSYRKLQLLFVDEVSMLGANYLDTLNYVCQQLRNNQLPMGGIRIVFGGDMMQLPPVKDEFPFQSASWPTLNLKYVRLVKAWRFDNQQWVDLLQRARLGQLNDVDKAALESRLNIEVPSNVVVPPIYLASRNDVVDEVNSCCLDSIQEATYTFLAKDYVINVDPQGIVTQMFPEQLSSVITNQFIVDRKLDLKVGCQVMLLANLDVEKGLTNGTRGIVKRLRDDAAIVKFDVGTFEIAEHTFKLEDNFKWYARVALPLRLAFATSIHKSQSLTLDSVEIDIGSQVFSEGQSYVALSRCKSLKGLYIRKLDISKIRPHALAMAFEQQFMKTCVNI